MTIKNIYQLECVPDFRLEGSPSVDYAATYDDAQSKLISVLEAIYFMGAAVTNASSKKNVDIDELNSLGGVISDLSEVAIMMNGITTSLNYYMEIKDGSGVTAK